MSVSPKSLPARVNHAVALENLEKVIHQLLVQQEDLSAMLLNILFREDSLDPAEEEMVVKSPEEKFAMSTLGWRIFEVSQRLASIHENYRQLMSRLDVQFAQGTDSL